MSTNIVDRRNNPKGKSSENRQRLLKRVEDQIKNVIPDIIKNDSVKDLTSSKKGVKIPIKGIKEPQFTYNRETGNKKYVNPGNKEYTEGDQIKKPQNDGGKGRGRKGSNDPTVSEDEFTITINNKPITHFFI